MKKFVLCAVLGVLGFSANAGGKAFVTCGKSPPGVYNTGEEPILHLNYSTGGTGGAQGLVWVAAAAPGGSGGSVLSGGQWINDNGGLLPFHSSFGRNGVSISEELKFPGGGLTTAPYVGYLVGAGYGVVTGATGDVQTPSTGGRTWRGIQIDGVSPTTGPGSTEGTGQAVVNNQQTILNQTAKEREGGLNDINASRADRANVAAAQSSTHHMHALAHKNMIDSKSYEVLIVVEFIDCRLLPPEAKSGENKSGGTAQFGGRNGIR